MARHWNPLRDPDKTQTRSRSVIDTGFDSANSQFGQRPLFSEPGEDQPAPDADPLTPESKPDSITPTDGQESSNDVATLRAVEINQPVPFPVASFNVANPPTESDLRGTFGTGAQLGEAFIVRDGTGASKLWLVVKGGAGVWYYTGLTKAV